MHCRPAPARAPVLITAKGLPQTRRAPSRRPSKPLRGRRIGVTKSSEKPRAESSSKEAPLLPTPCYSPLHRSAGGRPTPARAAVCGAAAVRPTPRQAPVSHSVTPGLQVALRCCGRIGFVP